MNKQNSFDKYLTVVTQILKYIIIVIINVHILIAQNSCYFIIRMNMLLLLIISISSSFM